MSIPAEDLTDAIRDLIEVVRTADLDEVDLRALIGSVRSVADTLRPRVVDAMRMQAALQYEHFLDNVGMDAASPQGVDDARDGRLDPTEFFPYSPVVGPLNPIAPPVRMWRVHTDNGGEIHGDVTFGAAFNGPPDCVHGGVIAETMDELLGCVCVTNGLGGFTGTLTVIYRSPTPLGTRLTLRGWHDRSEGRKIFAKGTIHHGDTLCAEAEGIFIRSDSLPGGGVRPGAT